MLNNLQVINEVDVVTGTYITEYDNSAIKIDENENTIPITVWKKITCTFNGEKYGVFAIINNQKTKRICESVKGWGWPERNDNEEEIKIGTMYYCSMTLGTHKPFNLNQMNPKFFTSISKMIKTQESSRNTEEKASKSD